MHGALGSDGVINAMMYSLTVRGGEDAIVEISEHWPTAAAAVKQCLFDIGLYSYIWCHPHT